MVKITGKPQSAKFVEGLWGPVLLGAVLVCAYGAFRDSFAVTTVAVAVGCAVFAVGALLGFLFGIPRALASETITPVAARTAEGTRKYRPNTNLEQVSDWLTKILLGAGLVQLHGIANAFGRLVDGLKSAFGGDDVAHAFAGAEVIYFLIAGFMCGYLFTALRLQSQLEGV